MAVSELGTAYDLTGPAEAPVVALIHGLGLTRASTWGKIALMDELGIERAAMVGFSLGGMINRRCAMDHPGRVSALAILNASHDRGEEQQQIVEECARHRGRRPRRRHRHHAGALVYRRVSPRARRSGAAVRAIVLANDPPISLPTPVMTCEHDSGSTPAMSHAIAAEISGAETLIIPQLQHLGLIEQPWLFSQPVQDFLDRALT